ncbi:MAG TPA: protein kinase [Vicinamibacterales bacterium]|nr:protein kinase [Vicinamibacterales bacterium]
MSTLRAGSQVGSYEILAPIGAGGMGEVYRARDTKLKRDVAIKVLPGEFSRDPERLRRFRREAEVLATLNHPNIAQIYGLEETGETCCLVLEMVEGDTLSDRLAHGAMPVDEALGTARQIAEALEAAHGHDIVHRDLKPANIKVTPDGRVKVLDFGLAKITGPAEAGHYGSVRAEAGRYAGDRSVRLQPDLSQSPTMTTPAMTQTGMILGTASYMSPEQAKGRAADARSDIWAFGCVLYEMLSGKPAFDGDTVVETLGAILKSEPDWRALPQTTPPAVLSLLKRCLQKDRDRRTRDIADARFQIEEAPNEPASPVASTPLRSSRERLLWSALTLVLAGALAALGITYARSAPADLPEMRLEIGTPPGASLDGFAISPDGRALVYQATVQGKNQLWLRPLDSETAQPLAGTENGLRPFWSPDSRSVGFFAGGQLKRIDIAGGLVQTLAEAPLALGGAWSGEGTILFTQSSVEPLYRVPASGGKAVAVTEVKAPHVGHRTPHFLPDGRRFLFFAFGPPQSQGIYIGSLDSTETTRLIDAESAPIFAPPDYVLFARQGAVLAQRVNFETLQTLGDPLPVARQVATPVAVVASVALSAAMAGPVAYRADAGERQLRWVDRSGNPVGLLSGPDSAQPSYARLSPDRRTVALVRMVSGNNDVWLTETARDARQRFTSDPAREFDLVWSPDGSRIIFSSARKGVIDIYERSVSGGGTETPVWESHESKEVYDWSSDGRWILFATQSPKTAHDLWVLPMEGEKKPIAVAQTASEERNARFSPDGRWIAYESNESGRNEIYVQPFPGPGGRSPISTRGGASPQWQRDGKGLFYVDQGTRVMSVPVAANGPRVEPGTPVALFTLSQGATYEAAPDGQRFLINEITKDPSPITILLNWKPM